jgi:prepilin-type N-terminal cleavage/methylation domain-containing protein
MKKKRNNKGFSLVELIVVMAIMAILAVTLAPRLIQYVEKSKGASDQNVVNSIYNATKLALVDENLLSTFKSGAVNAATSNYVVDLDVFYNNLDGTFTVDTTNTNTAFKEIASVIGTFKLKSKQAATASDIVIVYDAAVDKVTVLVDYDGATAITSSSDQAAVTAVINAANYKITE